MRIVGLKLDPVGVARQLGHSNPATALRLYSHFARWQQGFPEERMMGLEPTTFCMASRRSSQLSYIRVGAPV